MEHKNQVLDNKELQSKKLPIDKTLIQKLIWTLLLVFDVVCSLLKIPFLSMITLYKMMFPVEKSVKGQLVLVNYDSNFNKNYESIFFLQQNNILSLFN